MPLLIQSSYRLMEEYGLVICKKSVLCLYKTSGRNVEMRQGPHKEVTPGCSIVVWIADKQSQMACSDKMFLFLFKNCDYGKCTG